CLRDGDALDRVRGALVAAQRQTVCGQGLLDLFDGLLAEVGDRRQLALGLDDEIADRLDADALEAVVRAHTELQLLDREVLHPVGERHLGLCAVPAARGGLAEALDPVEVGEDGELPDQDLRGLCNGVLRADRPVGRDVQAPLVVVRPLADASGLDVISESPCSRQTRFLRLRMMSVTSSRTPVSVVNSCEIPSIFTEVTAAPSSEESRTRRSELPNV